MLYIKLKGNDCFFVDVTESVVGCFCTLGKNGIITQKKLCDYSYLDSLKNYELITQTDKINTSSLIQHLMDISGDSRETINSDLIQSHRNDAAYNNLIKSINCMDESYLTTDIEVREATAEEIDQLKCKLTLPSYKKIWYVRSKKQDDLFINNNKLDKTEFMYHGSPDHNWFSIINNGLKISKSIVKNGTSHGMGIYMSNNFHTANGYAQSYIGVFETIYDNHEYHIKSNIQDYEMEALAAGRSSYSYGTEENHINVFFETRSVAIRYLIEV